MNLGVLLYPNLYTNNIQPTLPCLPIHAFQEAWLHYQLTLYFLWVHQNANLWILRINVCHQVLNIQKKEEIVFIIESLLLTISPYGRTKC